MGTLEEAKQAEFIGQEFATWLAYLSETRDGHLNVPDLEPFELWFDSPLELATDHGDATIVGLKGNHPMQSPEARQALREGKQISKARLRLTVKNMTFTFSFNALTFDIGSLKIPAPSNENPADLLMVRLEVFEEFEAFWQSLYDAFLRMRVEEKEWNNVAVDIADWIRRD